MVWIFSIFNSNTIILTVHISYYSVKSYSVFLPTELSWLGLKHTLLYFSLFLKNKFTFISRGHYIPRPGLKSFARKSTGTAMKSFSYYRMPVDPLDLSSISTRMSISGMEITLNATKMAEIINLNPTLKIKKCKQTSWVSKKLNCNSPSSITVVFSSRVFNRKMPKRKIKTWWISPLYLISKVLQTQHVRTRYKTA